MPENEFYLVETAQGGAQNRGVLQAVQQVSFRPGESDNFATCFQYTEELRQHLARTTRPASGKPSVAGYRGPCWAPIVPFDFDCAANPAVAREEAIALIWLIAQPPPARHAAAAAQLHRQRLPWTAGAQHEQHAGERLAIGDARPAALGLRQVGWQQGAISF
jgi:hypothetical protein